MSGTKGMMHYRVETKQGAVRLVLEEHHSYAEVAVLLGIRKSARIEAWVHMYRREGELSLPQANWTSSEETKRAERVGTFADGERLAKKIPYRIARHAARTAQYRVIYHFREEFAVKAMSEFFAVSRAAYYEWVKKLEEPDPDQERLEQVQAVYQTSHR